MAAKGRVEVQCPHCGNIQLEPELAKSTYCRKCSRYILLNKGRKSTEPQELEQQPSVFHKLEGLIGIQRTVVARCFECTGKREVPKSATSTICPLCGAYIDLQDYRIIGHYSRSIRTRGRLIITSKGDLTSNRAICNYAKIQGTMRGNLVCSGEVHIRLRGKLSGSIEAKSVHIDKKCEAEFVRPIRAELVNIEGIISARIISSGKVLIQKTGRLTGAVFGRGFSVEKGGEFFGELSIGKVEMTQGELLDAPTRTTETKGKSDTGADFSLVTA
ncbi:MAG: polymer-forming cytoskeletal protein [Verrucomicrobia bacterium]|nr:polymer-forming cytoskeletal protein [Verrucomicrobiota bacterium]